MLFIRFGRFGQPKSVSLGTSCSRSKNGYASTIRTSFSRNFPVSYSSTDTYKLINISW